MEIKEPSTGIMDRSYAEYQLVEHLSFDPLADLNLPASYEEVVNRYRRLRGDRYEPHLN